MCEVSIRRQIGNFRRIVIRFIVITVSRSMGCFLACFRARDDRHPSPRSRGVLESPNRLSSLFLPKDAEDCSFKERADFSFETTLIDKELKYEAKFLKDCGTIPDTPPEISKGSEKFKTSDVNVGHSNIESFPSQKCIKKLHLGEYPDQPSSAVKLHGAEAKDSHSSLLSFSSNTPESVKPAVQFHANLDDNIAIPVSPWNSDTNIQQRSKSVRFVCDVDPTSSGSLSEYDCKGSKKFETPVNQIASKPSPNPTPLKLSYEMQTPGTVYPTPLENSVNGKARIRSQYVYSIPNPVETAYQRRVMNDLDPNSPLLLADVGESVEQLDSATPVSSGVFKESPIQKNLIVDNQFAWKTQAQSINNATNQCSETVSVVKPPFGRTPGDRPIIGHLATPWNDDETINDSPVWWDGNGIPNSTRKYKEDQKVSWHATPFEERLEKALSNEIPIPQRKPLVSTAILFEENEENEMEPSLLDSGDHPRPPVSC